VKRGDVVLMADGKPRPAVVVQADTIASPITLLLCPLSSTLVDAPLYRPVIEPDATNGLAKVSQLMIDKIGPIDRSRIDKAVGTLSADDVRRMDVALAVVLALG
jgi:mRNA interferase MazF